MPVHSLLRSTRSVTMVGDRSAGGWRAAFRRVKDATQPDDAMCLAAVSSCSRAGRWQEAILILKRMGRSGAGQQTEARMVSPLSRAYTTTMATCGRARQWRAALELLRQMDQRGEPPDTHAYNAALGACARAGKMSEMGMLLREMKSGGRRCAPDTVSFTSLMDGYTRAKQEAMALRVFDRLPQLGIERDSVSYTSALAACASAGMWKRSLAILEAMESEGLDTSPRAVSSAMTACTNSDQPAQVCWGGRAGEGRERRGVRRGGLA